MCLNLLEERCGLCVVGTIGGFFILGIVCSGRKINLRVKFIKKGLCILIIFIEVSVCFSLVCE